MLTHAVCRPTPRARSLQTTAVIRNVLRPTNTSLLLKASHRQQTRGFRFGMWSSYLDPEFQKEMLHRHRATKHKYIEAINRKLSWQGRTLDGHPKAVLKDMFRRYWDPNQVRCGSRFVNHDEMDRRRQHVRDGNHPRKRDYSDDHMTSYDQRLRDIYNEQRALFQQEQLQQQQNDLMRKEFQRIQDLQRHAPAPSITHSTTQKFSQDEPSPLSSTPPTEDFIIDPITNRKVPRRDGAPLENPTSTTSDSFKAYRAQFTAFGPPEDEVSPGPVHSNGPPPPKELKEYGQVEIDQVPHDVSTQQSVIESEEYALNHLPAEEPIEIEPTKKYEDLDEYKPYLHNENATIENKKAPYDDLDKYGPYKHEEDVERNDDTSPKYDDLDNYQHYHDEALQSTNDSASKYEDLGNYRTTHYQDSPVQEQPFQEYGDLEKYKAFKYQGLDDKIILEQDIVADSLKEVEAKEQVVNFGETSRPSISDRLKKLDLNETPSLQMSSAPLPVRLMPQLTYIKEEDQREFLEQSMVSHNEASNAADREASSNIRESRAKSQNEGNSTNQRTFTGNYVRDFPEEFSGSWGTRASHSSSEPSISDEEAAHIQAAEKQYADQISNLVNFDGLGSGIDKQQTGSKLEPALDRQESGATENKLDHDPITQAEVDPYSKEPQGLETSYTKECDGEHDSPTFKMYGGEPEPPSVKAESQPGVFHLHSSYFRDPELDARSPVSSLAPEFKLEPTPTSEPTVYKILAYDPSTQQINIAETTSVVPDQATPLTPAEVLLRLSNPTKFFPHFAPLQAEGFEIVSGEGDVLVFRQVRHSKTTDSETGAPVNPIDLMGKSTALPNAAAFVSPTGFVNYDVPKVEEEPQTTPFRSGIDVRREEPVFSGPKVTKEEARKEKGKKKKGLGKRVLLGGAWVAGVSYGLGVVSEYFQTGGY
ncbi:hypothetical protein F5B19DRAFT_453479 [Rostrohypoxylon terebratum]|nr:hypothetical protein F5B19DRAFT_453479 [Rostrohypoxylon terebratum]